MPQQSGFVIALSLSGRERIVIAKAITPRSALDLAMQEYPSATSGHVLRLANLAQLACIPADKTHCMIG